MTEPERPTAEVWSIPRRIWFVLMSWGIAVVVLATLFSYAIDRSRRAQDEAMCEMTEIFLGDPEPVSGPAGERSRAVRAAMSRYHDSLRCGRFD